MKYLCCTLVAAFVILCIHVPAPAEDRSPGSSHPTALISPDPLSVIAGPVQSLRETLQKKAGLDFGLGYTLIYQFTDRDEVVEPRHTLLTGSYDFYGFWALVPQDRGFGTGGLGWLVEGGHNIGYSGNEDLSANTGSALGLNDDADPKTEIGLTELWWEHSLKDKTTGNENSQASLLTVTVGKIDQTVFFDTNRVANDETTQFLATPLVNSVAVSFPDNGAGLNVQVRPNELMYITAGFGDANAVATRGPEDLEVDELFWAAEIGMTPAVTGLGPGAYRLMAWTTRMDDGDGGSLEGSGFSVSMDQEVFPGVIPFVRFSRGDEEVLDFETMFSAGVGIEGPFGRADDMAGIGYAWGKPSDHNLDAESLLEIFYRIKLTDSLELSPIVQTVFEPAANPEEDTVVVGTVRAQFSF